LAANDHLVGSVDAMHLKDRLGDVEAAIDSERHERQYPNLSSAIRLFVLDRYRRRP
jgi:hypothetical protein